jgi:hypothetical protein
MWLLSEALGQGAAFYMVSVHDEEVMAMAHRVRIALVIATGIAAGLVAVWKLQPDRRSDAQQILSALADIQQAVDDKSVSHAMRYVSESYKDSTVDNKRELIRLAQSGFYERGAFHCQLQVGRPVIRALHATADVTVDFGVERDGRISRVNPFVVKTEWVKERKGWRIVRAEGYMDAQPAFQSDAY